MSKNIKTTLQTSIRNSVELTVLHDSHRTGIFVANRESCPIVLLERFEENHKPPTPKTVNAPPSKIVKPTIRNLLSQEQGISSRPGILLYVLKPTPQPITQEDFLGGLGLKLKPRIPVLSISKKVNPVTGAKVFSVANKTNSVEANSLFRHDCSLILNLKRPTLQRSCSLLSPIKPKPMIGQPSLDTSITSTDSESLEEPSNELLQIDVSSPMGTKLKSLVSSQCQKCSTIRYYDQYCNRIQTQADSRSLRSQTTYCKY